MKQSERMLTENLWYNVETGMTQGKNEANFSRSKPLDLKITLRYGHWSNILNVIQKWSIMVLISKIE